MSSIVRTFALGLLLTLFAPLALAVQILASTPLTGPAENPPNASPGVGTAAVTLDTTAHTLHVIASFSGLTANTTAAHIHCCTAPPANVGVATQTPSFVGFPLGVTSGSMNQTYDTTQASTWNAAFIAANGGTPAGAEAALAVGMTTGQAYFNIHTTAFPGGEIRGFLVLQSQPGIGNIPTLSQWGLIGLAVVLAGAAWFAMRRRMR
jgi:hypothetical protein